MSYLVTFPNNRCTWRNCAMTISMFPLNMAFFKLEIGKMIDKQFVAGITQGYTFSEYMPPHVEYTFLPDDSITDAWGYVRIVLSADFPGDLIEKYGWTLPGSTDGQIFHRGCVWVDIRAAGTEFPPSGPSAMFPFGSGTEWPAGFARAEWPVGAGDYCLSDPEP
jgi:hypothetical protein